MPDYCYNSNTFAPQYVWTIDYEVPFNQNITKPAWDIQSDTEFIGLTCTKNFTMEVWINKLTNLGTDPIPGPGVAISGSLIAPGLSGDGYDAFATSIYGPLPTAAAVAAKLPT